MRFHPSGGYLFRRKRIGLWGTTRRSLGGAQLVFAEEEKLELVRVGGSWWELVGVGEVGEVGGARSAVLVA